MDNVNSSTNSITLHKYLTINRPNAKISRVVLRQLIQKGFVRVNGTIQKDPTFRIFEHDFVEVEHLEQSITSNKTGSLFTFLICNETIVCIHKPVGTSSKNVHWEGGEEFFQYNDLLKGIDGILFFVRPESITSCSISMTWQALVASVTTRQSTNADNETFPFPNVHILSTTGSNKLGRLSAVIWTTTTSHDTNQKELSVPGILKRWHDGGQPVVGHHRWCAHLSEGSHHPTFLQLIKMEITVSQNQKYEVPTKFIVERPVLPRFQRVFEREQKFYERKNREIETAPASVPFPSLNQNLERTVEFCGLEFKVNQFTLKPRSSSQVLVDAALKRLTQDSLSSSVLDLGTGCGSLLLSVLCKNLHCSGIGIDISEEALEIAKENSNAFNVSERVKFIKCDFGALELIQWEKEMPLEKKKLWMFEVILCNPPYLSSTAQGILKASSVNEDPAIALYSNQHGFGSYIAIARSLGKLLQSSNNFFHFLIIEVKHKRAIQCLNIFQSDPLFGKFIDVAKVLSDKYGLERAIEFKISKTTSK